MFSQKYLPKHKPSIDDQLKLPHIPSRKNIQSLKKNSPPLLDLPQIKNKPPKQNLSETEHHFYEITSTLTQRGCEKINSM